MSSGFSLRFMSFLRNAATQGDVPAAEIIRRDFKEYVLRYTNAATVVSEEFADTEAHQALPRPLTPDDTTEYLRMRLERAGCTREVFASDATVLLHEATVGAMRDLDRLAAAALRESARKKRKLVERDVVTQVIEADTRERDR